MQNTKSPFFYLEQIASEVEKQDRLHSKKINANVAFLKKHFPDQLTELLNLIEEYFNALSLSPKEVVNYYLKMISDMRKEGLYFYQYGKYRCDNQSIANDTVYSKPDIMKYYMNALLISQVLWKHHFNIFMFFQKEVRQLSKNNSNISILDVGPGHGFFSYLIKKEFPDYLNIDIIDISDTSLQMTKNILGFDGKKITYSKADIFNYEVTNKYDFIVLGEVLEHLDQPKEILVKLSKHLNANGVLWITTPTNSPAIDHVYLFKTKDDVLTLISEAGLEPISVCNYFAEEVDDQTALKMKITNLIGVFCKIK